MLQAGILIEEAHCCCAVIKDLQWSRLMHISYYVKFKVFLEFIRETRAVFLDWNNVALQFPANVLGLNTVKN